MPDTLTRASVSVWLPAPAHAALTAVAAAEGVSLAVLARRAAASAVEAPGGRVAMPAPAADAVEQLREVGHAWNRLLPAMNTACTDAQRGAIAARIGAALDRITATATRVRLTAPSGAGSTGVGGDGWRLVRVTVEPATVEVWSVAAQAAGFRSVANWVRDALAGLYGLAVARPPTPVTIDARQVVGRLLGLIAQTETAGLGAECDRRIEAAADAVYAALHSLIGYGGDPKARR